MSKGSTRRPGNQNDYAKAWDKIFGKKMKVEIYSKDHCPFCDKAIALAKMKDMDLTVKKLSVDFNLHDLLEVAPNARTFPQIFIDGENIGGYTEFSKMYG
tara:strand:+ start:838 stop:1137 length:300 start_codon:yes stop_codon:yes gene_type:complete